MLTAEQKEAYLLRVGHEGDLAPTLDTLRALQWAHLLAVPFENLDIHAGREIVLDEQRIFAKVVGRGQGGFCYELNGLFFGLLASLGYDVRRVSARVFMGEEKGYGPPFDHLALVVTLPEGEYLVDVGFGDFSHQPLPLAWDAWHDDPRGRYGFRRLDEGDHLVVMEKEGQEVPLYRLTLEAQPLAAFAEMCTYQQASPDSCFCQNKLITRPTAGGGRITLTSQSLKVTERCQKTETPVADAEQFDALLFTHFGIILHAPDELVP
mmetsp:Transcript_24689/g.57330  ORF Transcript_24689/g.57330 Transcript_24689/m.57330 type:complete len:265 (-) Transcript_24689:38-832(-)